MITFEQMRDAVKAEIDEVGEDFVYQPFAETPTTPSCRYEHDGKPSCLIGRALYRLGTPIELLSAYNKIGGVRTLVNEGVLDISGVAASFAALVQHEQDCGVKWGEAYTRSLGAVDEYDAVC